MASTSDETSNHSTLLDQFCTLTGSDREKGEKMLEICNWNLEMAANMHWDTDCSLNGVDHPSFEPTTPEKLIPNKPPVDSDGVRAPIPPTRGVLVEDDYAAHIDIRGQRRRARSVVDGLRDFQAEARWHSEMSSEFLNDPVVTKKRKTLEDLFRPPLDLMHRGSFESAREKGRQEKKWLMVNVQDSGEFQCQVLNRDVWSNSAVKSIVSEHFVFWQVYCDSVEGQRYMQFYKPVTFPYVAVIDPRTGENIIVWNKLDSAFFCEAVIAFLSEHSNSDDTFSLCKTEKNSSIVNTSEEQQMKVAIEASLRETVIENADEDSGSDIETFDSDSESQHGKLNCKIDENSSEVINEVENWQVHLGPKEDEETNLILRLPDGKRECVTWPCSTKIKALLLYSESLGFSRDKYELITNFPRKNLSELPFTKTLKELGLYPREMIFVQSKNS